MVSCGAQRVNANTPSPMDPDEVRLQATEVMQELVTAHLYISWKVLRHENFRWLTAHTPILGENNGHPSGLGLFENDIAIVKVNGTLPCKKKEIWPACLPTPVIIPGHGPNPQRIPSWITEPSQMDFQIANADLNEWVFITYPPHLKLLTFESYLTGHRLCRLGKNWTSRLGSDQEMGELCFNLDIRDSLMLWFSL